MFNSNDTVHLEFQMSSLKERCPIVSLAWHNRSSNAPQMIRF
jgi:hypothetical protein